MKNNKQTKKAINCFLQDGARANAGIRSLQTCIVVKLCQTSGNGLQVFCESFLLNLYVHFKYL